MIEQRLRRYFTGRAGDENLVAAYLFGSVARGDDDARSDVDVAVLHRRDPPATFDALPDYVWKGRSSVSSVAVRR